MSNSVWCDIHREVERDYYSCVRAYNTHIYRFFLQLPHVQRRRVRSQNVEKTRDYLYILASVLTVAGTPSSCRAPWFDTRIPFTPIFTASLASSAKEGKKEKKKQQQKKTPKKNPKQKTTKTNKQDMPFHNWELIDTMMKETVASLKSGQLMQSHLRASPFQSPISTQKKVLSLSSKTRKVIWNVGAEQFTTLD